MLGKRNEMVEGGQVSVEVEEMKLRISRDLNHERETERMKATELKISTKVGGKQNPLPMRRVWHISIKAWRNGGSLAEPTLPQFAFSKNYSDMQSSPPTNTRKKKARVHRLLSPMTLHSTGLFYTP